MFNPINLISKFIKSSNQKELDKLAKIVSEINAYEPKVSKLRNEDFPIKTDEFKEKIKKGESLDNILPEAFAYVREAAKRTINERHYDVQIIGGIVLHQGKIAEMKIVIKLFYMIRYKLNCKKCNNVFHSWFSSSKEYDKLKRIKQLNCYNCGSIKIEKTLMAPNVTNTKKKNLLAQQDKKFIKIKNKIKKYQKFIKKNFDYVGNNFAYKARALHYSDKKKLKGIYGKASSDEISDLKNEGIETEVIPWFDDKEN